jgi:hypothetical protein
MLQMSCVSNPRCSPDWRRRMSLIACPICTRRIPSTATRCLHCGTLAPDCPDCRGSGRCTRCQDATFDSVDECPQCGGSGRCPACEGRQLRWAAAEPPAGSR